MRKTLIFMYADIKLHQSRTCKHKYMYVNMKFGPKTKRERTRWETKKRKHKKLDKCKCFLPFFYKLVLIISSLNVFFALLPLLYNLKKLFFSFENCFIFLSQTLNWYWIYTENKRFGCSFHIPVYKCILSLHTHMRTSDITFYRDNWLPYM